MNNCAHWKSLKDRKDITFVVGLSLKKECICLSNLKSESNNMPRFFTTALWTFVDLKAADIKKRFKFCFFSLIFKDLPSFNIQKAADKQTAVWRL